MAQGMDWTATAGSGFAKPSSLQLSLPWRSGQVSASASMTAFSAIRGFQRHCALCAVAIFSLCGMLVLCGRQRTDRVQHILSGGGLWFAAVLFGEVVSYTSGDSYSVSYGLLFAVIFLCARLDRAGDWRAERGSAPIRKRNCYALHGPALRQTHVVCHRGAIQRGYPCPSQSDRVHFGGLFPSHRLARAGGEDTVEEAGPDRPVHGLLWPHFHDRIARQSVSGARRDRALLIRGMSSGWLQKLRVRHLHIIVVLPRDSTRGVFHAAARSHWPHGELPE